MSRTGTNVESKGAGWRFVMRINPSNGSFWGLEGKEKFTRPLRVSSEAEALVMAQAWREDIKHLQRVSQRDALGQYVSQPELREALRTFLWFNDIDPDEFKRIEQGTTAALRARAPIFRTIKADIISFYRVDGFGGLSFRGKLGAAIHDALETGREPAPCLSDTLNRYHSTPRGPSRAPWSQKAKSDNKRYCELFEANVGRLTFDQIKRKDVNNHIVQRLKQVGATSVQRELNSLRAIWMSARQDADLNQRNPFEAPVIPGLGESTKQVAKANLNESRRLINHLKNEGGQGYVEPLTMLLLLTGCRLAEVWGIEPDDVDFERSILHIRPNSLRRLKNKSSCRMLPMTPLLQKWVQRYLAEVPPGSSNSASASIGKFLKQKLRLSFTAHGLRHGMRDRLQEANARGSDIEGIQGWKSSDSMLHDYGIRDFLDEKRRLLEAVYLTLEIDTGQVEFKTTTNSISEVQEASY